ncbi:aminotransferase DegT, partial [Salmonella enterica subsp. enterica serovar Typhimurium]
LHVALQVSGVKRHDEVLVPSMTFIAPLNAIRYVGAWPLFMDSDPNCWQMDAAKVRAFIALNCEMRDGKLFNLATGRQVAAILPVHILGIPGPIEEYKKIAEEFGLKVIDDATESLGATVDGKPIGAVTD